MSRQRHQQKRPKPTPHARTSSTLPHPVPKDVSAFCERVRFLIDKHFDGNVAGAARTMGVSQRGLAHVYSGERTEPRLGLVQALFRTFPGVDREWLIVGKHTDVGRQIEAAARQQARLMAKQVIDDIDNTPDPRRRAAGH